MKHILVPILLVVLLFPTLAFGETVDWNDLVVREGLHYKKFTEVPFTGKVTGDEQGSYKNGKREGPWVRHYDNGQLRYKGNYKDDKEDGPWVYYWNENGQLYYKGTFKDGKEDGPWVFYYYSGKLLSKGTYKNGKRHGPWVMYNDDGNVVDYFTGTFKDGVKVK